MKKSVWIWIIVIIIVAVVVWFLFRGGVTGSVVYGSDGEAIVSSEGKNFECDDPDAGKGVEGSLFEKGIAVQTHKTNGGVTSREDVCDGPHKDGSGTKSIREGVCGAQGNVIFVDYDCPDGSFCVAGACDYS